MRSESRIRTIDAVGIVLPVHNEETHLPDALQAIGGAAARLPSSLPCVTAVVLDACTDDSANIANQWAKDGWTDVVPCEFGNVGAARRTGCQALLLRWRNIRPSKIWLATTDADSQVPADWLVAQLHAYSEGADMWTGRVEVNDWSSHKSSTSLRWLRQYRQERAPIHGANMGLTAHAYLQAGGFPPLATGEDRALHQSVLDAGARVHHDQVVKVTTSARRTARAPLGFAHVLTSVEAANAS